jgi:aspartyl protease family protein
MAALAAAPGHGAPQTLTKCSIGEQVTDNEGHIGVIVAADGEVCQLRYDDGQTRGWASWSLRPAVAPSPGGEAGNSIVLRGYDERRRLVYRADSRGHFTIAATVNGAPLRFLVDTGATLVFLTPGDAQAVGIDPSTLVFDQNASTSNGKVRIAPVVLREAQIKDLSVERVPAAVVETLGQMSFLGRLKSFEIRSGVLTIDW